MKRLLLIAGASALAYSMSAGAADVPTPEQLWKRVQEQQAQIDALRAELNATRASVANTEQQVLVTEQKVESADQRIAATESMMDAREEEDEPAAEWARNSQFGGYGELHYNGGDADELDLHRFVLYFGHQFNDRTRFVSEFEIEHAVAGDGEPGEVEVEQAYVEFDLNQNLRAKGGVYLVPVGILNEVHEPTTFYGVERNPVETRIIPTTWWEGGAMLSGRSGSGWSWDAAVHSGLDTGSDAGYAIRNGRQKVAEAVARDGGATGRIKYTGVLGLQLAATVQYQSDITQGKDPAAGSAWLFETHAIWNWQSFMLKALYARWNLEGSGPKAIGANIQEGFYIEPSYRINNKVGVFARYNEWDNRAGDSIDSRQQLTSFGLNYWPHPNVVLKADYQIENGPSAGSDDDRINLGIGYQF
jgi:outer membrane murein-binding lipoprotein Lpp